MNGPHFNLGIINNNNIMLVMRNDLWARVHFLWSHWRVDGQVGKEDKWTAASNFAYDLWCLLGETLIYMQGLSHLYQINSLESHKYYLFRVPTCITTCSLITFLADTCGMRIVGQRSAWRGEITRVYIDGLVQNCSNSIANALELLQSCTKPSIRTYLSKAKLSPKKIKLPPCQ